MRRLVCASIIVQLVLFPVATHASRAKYSNRKSPVREIFSQVPTFAPSSFLQTPSRLKEAQERNILKRILKNMPERLKHLVTLEEYLGSGSFGDVVLLSLKCAPLKKVALKAVTVQSIDDEAEIRKEARIMRKMGPLSNYVISLVGTEIKHGGYMFLMMPYQNKEELFDLIGQIETVEEDEPNLGSKALQVALWVHAVKGVKDLHGQGITHMDLKPNNVLVNCNGMKCHATVIDVGVASESTDRDEHVINDYPCSEEVNARQKESYEKNEKLTAEEEECIALVEEMTGERMNYDIKDVEDESKLQKFKKNSQLYYKKVYNKHGLSFADSARVLLKSESYPVKVVFFALPGDCYLRGTPGYVSPETLKRLESSDEERALFACHPSNDLWALGLMLRNIATKSTDTREKQWARHITKFELDQNMRQELYIREVLEGTKRYTPDKDKVLNERVEPKELMEMIKGLLNPNPEKRYDVGDIMKDVEELMRALASEQDFQYYMDMINLRPSPIVYNDMLELPLEFLEALEALDAGMRDEIDRQADKDGAGEGEFAETAAEEAEPKRAAEVTKADKDGAGEAEFAEKAAEEAEPKRAAEVTKAKLAKARHSIKDYIEVQKRSAEASLWNLLSDEAQLQAYNEAFE